MLTRVPFFLAALWWGSATAVGFWVVPLLFAHLGSAALAGGMASRLFTAQTWVALLCGLGLLLMLRHQPRSSASDVTGLRGWVLTGMLAALLIEVAVAPRILAREHLMWWHSLGTVLYVVQWLCAATALWRLSRANVS